MRITVCICFLCSDLLFVLTHVLLVQVSTGAGRAGATTLELYLFTNGFYCLTLEQVCSYKSLQNGLEFEQLLSISVGKVLCHYAHIHPL